MPRRWPKVLSAGSENSLRILARIWERAMSDEIGRPGGLINNRNSLFVAKDKIDRDRRELYEFGPFRLEPVERKLLRGNEIVVLTPKAFDTLVLLVRNSGLLLEKDELIRALWPDSFVEEGNLTNNISLLRKALGDDPAYIETVPKRGYRFVGAVHQLPKPVSRSLERGLGKQLELAKEISAEKQLSGGSAAPAFSNESRSRRALALITLTGLVLLVVAASHWLPRTPRSLDRS